MKLINHYLVATASWFTAFGLHSVLFVWLLAVQLQESPDRIGYAQMLAALPTALLVLVAGALADHYGGRRLALGSQMLAAAVPLMLVVGLWLDQLSYPLLMFYGLMLGLANAFLTPARDGLINLIAPGQVQRVVVLSSLMQFGFQIAGFTLAGLATWVNPLYLLIFQSLVLLLGAWSLSRITISHDRRVSLEGTIWRHLSLSLIEGGKTLIRSPILRSVATLNCAMGLCFMGSYVVTLPILVRDVYGGQSSDLALLNGVNSIGLVVTILLLIRLGELRRPGRAMLLTQMTGSFFLGSCGLVDSFLLVLGLIFAWGACGGIAISMARSLMQSQAPTNMRARVMSFYIFSFAGAGAVGSLLAGQLTQHFGAANALWVMSAGMFTMSLIVTLSTRLWATSNRPEARPA